MSHSLSQADVTAIVEEKNRIVRLMYEIASDIEKHIKENGESSGTSHEKLVQILAKLRSDK